MRSRLQYGSLSFAREFSVEKKSDKVIFSLKGGDNATYVYAQTADDRGLKCISDSCDSMFFPLSEEWVRVDSSVLGASEGLLLHHRKARRLVSGDFVKLGSTFRAPLVARAPFQYGE